MSLRIAVLSVHTCPLAALGGKETGGMNVYVRETARELGRMGVAVDVFTRSQNASIPRVAELGEGARVIHLPAGPQAPLASCRMAISGSQTMNCAEPCDELKTLSKVDQSLETAAWAILARRDASVG